MSRVMDALPERLLVNTQRDVVHTVRRPEGRPAAARPGAMAVLPDDAPPSRVDDDHAVVVVVVDRNVPVREHDREGGVVERPPARRRAVAPEHATVMVEDYRGAGARVIREEEPSAG